jgi:hypothetical protein
MPPDITKQEETPIIGHHNHPPRIADHTSDNTRNEVAQQLNDTLTTLSAPKEGFMDLKSYKEYVSQVNNIYAHEHDEFRKAGDKYRLRDPENPEKLRGHILAECADGRNSIMLFIPPKEALSRFDYEWVPSAGVILAPEVNTVNSYDQVAEFLFRKPHVREGIFKRFDLLFGDKIKDCLEDYKSGKLSSIYLEFQSHFDSENHPAHGCGAHSNNLIMAQFETIKNCILAEIWVKEKYPEEYKNGLFKIFRTTHDTKTDGPVVSSAAIDKKYLSERLVGGEKILDFAAKKYESPAMADAPQNIVRKFEGNPQEIETNEHDEQTIRVSNTHFASTIMGQSVLEICWTNTAATLFEHIKILLGIIEKNFRKRNPNKPAILHLDSLKGNSSIGDTYKNLMNLIKNDEDIQKKFKDGSLILCLTETNKETYKTEIV